MRAADNVEQAHFEGTPLSLFKNASPQVFTDILEAQPNNPTYVYEEEFPRQLPYIAQRYVSAKYSLGQQIQTAELRYTSESGQLGNETLPIYDYRHEIIQAVAENQFTICVAETGAGKSTQVPQFLLDSDLFNTVYITQPRRAASRNVYERIKTEIAEKRSEAEANMLVSFRNGGEHEGSDSARVQVVTDGLQLAKELDHKGASSLDVLIIDEVHEWNANIEFLVAWAYRQAKHNPNLRVVIMSATMDANSIANYYSEVSRTIPPIIEVPGRTFDVERREEPESTVAIETRKAAEKVYEHYRQNPEDPNGILVFEPGKREISEVIDEVYAALPDEVAQNATILPLHAKMSVNEQQAVFRHYPGTKIIISTNIAQTSLTIDDVKYVIDSGMERRIELDEAGTQGLFLHATSQADCDQRAGRAGRVSDGIYIATRMNEDSVFIPYINRAKFPLPEILRTDIVRNTLRIAGIGIDLADLSLFHSVEKKYIYRAQETLRALGALDEDNKITNIDKQMNQYPVCASSARMMVEASQHPENIRAYMSAIVASKEAGGLPYFAFNAEKKWRDLTTEKSSDLLAQLDIFIAAQAMNDSEISGHDLDYNNLMRAREQYRKIAYRAGALQETLDVPTEDERDILRECIYAGMITNVYIKHGKDTFIHASKSDEPREISNRSVVRGSPEVIVGNPYRVEYFKDGESKTKHIVEGVTTASLASIGRIATHLTEKEPAGFVMRGGKFIERERIMLFGNQINVTERPAEPSPRLRAAIIEHVIEHPGSQLQYLRNLKSQLEHLAHLSKDPVKQLTHDHINHLIRDAAPANITDPTLVDHHLRQIIEKRDIKLDTYVAPERIDQIIANAPPVITYKDVSLRLSYRSSQPYVTHYQLEDIAKLEDEIFLEDGRQVLFSYEGKKISLLVLQHKLFSHNSYN